MDIAEKYKKLTSIEHILKRSGMYIGAVEEVELPMWILDNNKIISKDIKYSPGLYKIFDEIIVNAYDQTVRDKTLTEIKVTINYDQVMVYNNGIGIDVVIHPKEKIYVPELIFSHLRTSTSFSDTSSETGGTYGYGAKLTAIFSSYFEVEVADSIHKKKFSQHYKNNLSYKSKPKITSYNNKHGYVKITFEPDFKFFKLTRFSEDMINLMKRRVYDIAALVRQNVKVYLNDKLIEFNTFDKYVDLFTESVKVKQYCDKWKIIITKSNGNYKQMSFVNGVNTKNGGRHVDYVMNTIIKSIKDIAQSKHKTKIKTQFIKDQMWLFLSCVIENPTFSSQSKDELTSTINKADCELDDNFIKRIYTKLDLDTIITQLIKSIQFSEIKELDKKSKKKLIGIKKLYDANYAGTKKSLLCTLILTEGDSAKTMAISGLSAIKEGNNTYGVFPLKGKLLNVREATHSQLIENEEFKNLKQIIGLQLNKTYTKDNISELRYGTILLMMDADVDGSHIKGLFINMIHYYWPSLLKINGFIKVFITPIVKVSYKAESLSFFNLTEYYNWKKKHVDISKWTIKYYKGLGSNTSAETKEYFMNLGKHVINFNWTENSDESILLAFSKNQSDNRKKWLKSYNSDIVLDYSKNNITYRDFINKELIHFSNYDNIRSIPSLLDGLKPSQRKVLYASFKKNLTTDIKVAQFGGYIAEQTSYHHGEVSLLNTIINMAQTFIGSNNINLLMPNGQFGTRIEGGKDCSSPRYIFTRLEEITRYIYIKDDDSILTYLDDDGFPIEPSYYVPIIPMLLVNGAEGIGSGYSTFIPKFNPMDIITNLENRIKGEKFKTILPWYNNFKGKVIRNAKNMFLTKGVYQKEGNTLHITELPIGVWTESYKYFLDTIILDLEYIKSIKNNCTDTLIDFKIKFHNEKTLKSMKDSDIEKIFGLSKKISASNMYLFDSNNKLKKYHDVVDILEEFYKVRLEYYDLRKNYILEKLHNEILVLESKMKFINLVITKKIDIFNKPSTKIIDILEKHKLLLLKDEPPYDYLIKMSFYSLTKEKIDSLKKTLDEKQSAHDKLKVTTIENLYLGDLKLLKKFMNNFA